MNTFTGILLLCPSLVFAASNALAVDRLVPSAYATIQDAVNASAIGDRVIVAPGTYSGPGNRDVNPLGKAITIMSAAGPALTVIECGGTPIEPHRAFNITAGSSLLVVEGFTIRNGFASTGGGIQIFGSASPVVRNCIIEGCAASTNGGGVYAFGTGAPMLEAVTFSGCTAPSGGGVHLGGTALRVLADCRFEANTATGDGGGVHIASGPVTLRRCEFTANQAERGGGVFTTSSGAVSIDACDVDQNRAARGAGAAVVGGAPVITGTSFSSNVASGDFGGALYVEANSSVSISTCTFTDNSVPGGSGGAIGFFVGAPTGQLTDCRFERNSASVWGGAIRFATSPTSPTFTGCTFVDNSADRGGAVAIRGARPVFDSCEFEGNEAAGEFGGAVYVDDTGTTVTLRDSTFSQNRVLNGSGGGLALWFGAPSATIDRCDFSHNQVTAEGGAIFARFEGELRMTECDLQSNTAERGAGVMIHGGSSGSMQMNRCVIAGNSATGSGGAAIFEDLTGSVVDCSFTDSTAGTEGGGVGLSGARLALAFDACSFLRNSAGTGGGVRIADASTISFTDCIIDGNTSGGWGGAAALLGAASTNFEGCTFSNNIAGGDGAGLLAWNAGGCTLTNCTIDGNIGVASGGGVAAIGSSRLTMVGGTSRNNTAAFDGGGVYVRDEAVLTLEDVDISANSATRGGGLACFASSAQPTMQRIDGCTVSGNSASEGGGAMVGSEAGAAAIFTSCTIAGNVSSGETAGFRHTGRSQVRLEDCTVRDNLAGSFGSVTCRYQAAPTLVRTVITNNQTLGYGAGGFHSENDCFPTLVGCTITGNTAAVNGGGVMTNIGGVATLTNCLVVGNAAGSSGAGAFAANGSMLSMVGCSLAGNVDDGTGVIVVVDAPAIIRNSIAVGPQGVSGLRLFGSGSADVAHSNIRGGFPGPGNINAEPSFSDPLNGDYSLQAGSLCVDAGDNNAVPAGVTIDLLGNPRFVDVPTAPNTGVPGGAGGQAIVDMGALETREPSCYPDCETSTGTGVLDIFDFLCFQNSYAALEPYACDCDTSTGPGVCDIFDFLCFQNAFAAGCP